MFGEASQLDFTFPLESAQNLVQKMERADWGGIHTKLQKYPQEISKSCKVGFVPIYISSNSLAKT